MGGQNSHPGSTTDVLRRPPLEAVESQCRDCCNTKKTLSYEHNTAQKSHKEAMRVLQGPPLEADESQYLDDYIAKRILPYGHKTAQVDCRTGCAVTFSELLLRSERLGAALRERGLGDGSAVAVVAENCTTYAWVLLGAMRARTCAVLLNPEYTPRELKHNMSISRPRVVLISYSVAMWQHATGTTTGEVVSGYQSVEEVWVWDAMPGVHMPDKCVALEAVLERTHGYVGNQNRDANIESKPADQLPGAQKSKDDVSEELKAANVPGVQEDVVGAPNEHTNIPGMQEGEEVNGFGAAEGSNVIALILSSSGSTGLPKGVMLSHRAVIAALQTGRMYAEVDDIALGLMPFFHAYGLILMLMCLCEGACVVVMKKFAVQQFFDVIQEHKINSLYLVPSLLTLLSKHEESSVADLRSVRHIWTGAAPVSRRLQAAVSRRFSEQPVTMHHSYGLTETTFTMLAGACRGDKPGSPGRLTPGVKCKVVDEQGQALGPLEEGELWFQCPLLMTGYKGNEKATRDTIDSDKWLHSGDLGYYDEDGYFFIVDRLKELIKYQGHQVSPSELEGILLTHSAVQDVAVVGVPHEVFGQLAQAWVVKQAGTDVTQAEIQDFLAVEVSPPKRLHGGVRFVDTIPKTPSGKILRQTLRELYSINKQ